MTPEGMIARRDPLGIRPLVMGRLNDSYIFASETVALDVVGATFLRTVEPGELVIVSERGVRAVRPFAAVRPRPCIFDHVDFSRPHSLVGTGRGSCWERRAAYVCITGVRESIKK